MAGDGVTTMVVIPNDGGGNESRTRKTKVMQESNIPGLLDILYYCQHHIKGNKTKGWK